MFAHSARRLLVVRYAIEQIFCAPMIIVEAIDRFGSLPAPLAQDPQPWPLMDGREWF